MKQKHIEKNRKGLNAVISLLPDLEKGITRIQYSGSKPVFQLIVGKELENRECVWIDTENHSSTYALTDIAGEDALEKTYIGRAFTPFQHHQLCMKIEEFIDAETEIIAIPAINGLYEDGQINKKEGEKLLEEALKHIKTVADRNEIKVILSNSSKTEGELEYLAGVYSHDYISVNETSQGLKFSNNNFKTLIYPESGVLQTTLPVWMDTKRGKKYGKNKRHIQATP